MAKLESKQYMTDLEALYTEHLGEEKADVRDGVLCYRVRTIKSGDMLESMVYPVYKKRGSVRGAREHVTREAQLMVNRRNAVRRMERMVQCNFTRDAIFVTCTYRQDPDREMADRQLDLYLQRLRRAAKKNGQELKYVAVTEQASTGRIHHHMLLEGVSRETAEGKWRQGFCNAKQYQQNKTQFVGLVRYMLKNRRTQDEAVCRRIRTSQGMVMPRETVSDHKVSIRKMEQICEDMQEKGAEILMQTYPGYAAEGRPDIRRSEFLPGAYMYVRMWRE